MSKFSETRTIRCRYGKEEPIIDEYVAFGWLYTSKQLLNRFGNPLPIDSRLNEKELRGKCFYDLNFSRETEKEDVNRLNSLQTEYSGLELKQTCFTGKRVTSCVFLTLFLIAFIVTIATNVIADKAKPIVVILTIITALGLTAIIATGIVGVFKNGKENNKKLERKEQLLREAKSILQKNE